LKQKLLIKEIHTAIKHLYTDKVVPHLHSCLDEIIMTSILRFEQMGLLEISGYSNKMGSRTDFVLSGGDRREKINETLEFIQSYREFNE